MVHDLGNVYSTFPNRGIMGSSHNCNAIFSSFEDRVPPRDNKEVTLWWTIPPDDTCEIPGAVSKISGHLSNIINLVETEVVHVKTWES